MFVCFVVRGESPGCLIWHSLNVGVVKKPPPPPLTEERYGNMEPKYPAGGHCQSVLRLQGRLTSPLIQWRRQRHLT